MIPVNQLEYNLHSAVNKNAYLLTYLLRKCVETGLQQAIWWRGSFFSNCGPFTPLPFLSPSPLLPPSSLPLAPLRTRPWNPARGLGSAVSSPAGCGAETKSKSNLVYFSLKIWHLVTTILIISWESTDQISCSLHCYLSFTYEINGPFAAFANGRGWSARSDPLPWSGACESQATHQWVGTGWRLRVEQSWPGSRPRRRWRCPVIGIWCGNRRRGLAVAAAAAMRDELTSSWSHQLTESWRWRPWDRRSAEMSAHLLVSRPSDDS